MDQATGVATMIRELKTESIANRLFAEAFDRPRGPRSDAYKRGVRDILRYLTGELPALVRPPFVEGTAENDAYIAGVSEGRTICRMHKNERTPA